MSEKTEKMKDFPTSTALVPIAKALLPAYFRLRHPETKLQVVGDGIDRFHSLKGTRTIVCPNHPHHADADIIFAFSRAVGEDFDFLTARELFHGSHVYDPLLRYMGCLPVTRGKSDRSALKNARDLLIANNRKLVVFPEGEVSHLNDALLPLKSGAIHIAFAALEELQISEPDAPVVILPLAVKYTYTRDIYQALNASLVKMESQLGIDHDPDLSLYAKLQKVGFVVLDVLEREYGLEQAPAASLNERLDRLRSTILKQVASFLSVELDADRTQLDWAHTLQATIYDERSLHEVQSKEPFQSIQKDRDEQLASFSRDINRVINLIAVYHGYIGDPATQEQFADIIDCLEDEVLGEVSVKGPRLILIDVGEPIGLNQYHSQYGKDKASAVRTVNRKIVEQLYGRLERLDSQRHPVEIGRDQ